MEILKYSALGNDYIVVDPLPHSSHHQQTLVHELHGEDGKGCWYTSPDAISLVCDRHRGIGSDGILLAISFDLTKKRFGLRIFNSDGSEAEKSGNGLRIFARYICEFIWDKFDIDLLEFTLWTPKAGDAMVNVLTPASSKTSLDASMRFRIRMGVPSTTESRFPILLPREGEGEGEGNRELLSLPLQLSNYALTYSCVNMGNPHCVITEVRTSSPSSSSPSPSLLVSPSPSLASSIGPLLENHPQFPQRTNCQFVSILSRSSIFIEIWERGSGYTLASGSSSSASAFISWKLGLVDRRIQVQQPGGVINIEIEEEEVEEEVEEGKEKRRGRVDAVWMTGEVDAVFRGQFHPSFFARLSSSSSSSSSSAQ